MKRKGLVVFALAAGLSMGTATFSSWAAEGWAQSGSSWVYYDSNGNKLTDAWKKGADNLWRYLDGYGVMAVNSWVDGNYYVDSNGILVTDKWQKLNNGWNNYDNEYHWYYFGSTGKALTDTWKKIGDKWYYFNEDSEMQTGWIENEEYRYFAGEDGAMKTGWQRLMPYDAYDNDDDRVTPESEYDDGKNWYYFLSSGKMYAPDSGSRYKEYKIDGAYYCFDEEGAMQTGWVNLGPDADDSASIEDYKYYGTDGKARTGWFSIEPPEKLQNTYGEVEWFYFSNSGKPKVGPKEGEAKSTDIVKINGISYLFNDKGNPVYGLQKVYINGSDYTAYYFGDKKTSSVVKGKRKIEEGDGNEIEFYFAETGRGFTGVKDNYLYYMGKLQKAEDGSKYQVISIPNGNNVTNYVVNTSGRVAKSTTVKNADGVKYKTGSGGVLQKEDDETPSSSYETPSEPVWTY